MVAASPVSTPDCRYLNRRSSDGCENTRSSNWSEDEALNRSASTLRSLSRGHWLCPPRNRRSRHEYDRTSDCRLLPLFARDSGGYLLSNDPCGNERRARHGTRRGNVLHYQDRTRKLVALLEDRLPTFREKLKAVLHQLQQYLFEYRKIEDRARLVRSFSLHLNRNPDWAPRNWDEAATPPEWVRLATPLQLACHADVTQPESEDILREIAATIPAYAEARVERRPLGQLDEEPGEAVVVVEYSPLKKAVRSFFADAVASPDWLSARHWWREHPALVGTIGEDIWLLRLVSENERSGTEAGWSLRMDADSPPHFDGNLLIHDIHAARKGQ